MRFISTCIFIFLSLTVLFAVNLNQPIIPAENIEKVYVDISQHILVSGQYLNYKAYIVNPSNPDNTSTSKILYFEIIDSAYQKVMTWRCNVSDGLTSGSVELPDTISGGLYYLRSFTNWMRNFGTEKYFTTPIIITHLTEHKLNKLTYPSNHQIILTENDTLKENSQVPVSLRKNIKEITVKLSKNTYKRKEKVSIELFANLGTDEILNASVTVNEINKLEKIFNIPDISDLSVADSYNVKDEIKNNHNVLQSPKYQLESKGYILTGRLIDDSLNTGIQKMPVYLSKIDSIVQFKYTETNSLGEFGFLTGTNYDNHKLVFQCPQITKNSKYRWDIDNKWDSKDTVNRFSTYFLSQDEENELENIRKTELIKKLYQKGTKTINNKNFLKQPGFYFTPDYVVKPSDYEELTDFADISNNILPLVKFKKTRNGYSFYVFLKEIERDASGDPGLFLNGSPFFNLDYIASLTYKDIEHIEVCTHPIMYGNQTFYGIVSIYTYKLDLNPDVFNNPIHRIDNKVAENGTISNNNILVNRQTLFFTQCIYWNPSVSIEENKPVKIEFDTPNIETEYEISVRGLTNKGVPYSKSVIFKIEE